MPSAVHLRTSHPE